MVLLTTSRNDRANVITMVCRPTDTICLFLTSKAWTEQAQKNPKTVHHHGYGTFVVDGETIHLKSKMP